MLDKVMVLCPFCKKMAYHSVPLIEGQIKAMKIGKVGEVVQQLKEKRGPFYDKWLAAMEKRGEQRRCNECQWFAEYVGTPSCWPAGLDFKEVNPGQFACKAFTQRA